MPREILVTAGASGIGKAIAAAFLATGNDVYVCDVNPDAVGAAIAELPGLKTGICDVGDRSQVETMVAGAADQLGGIDVLVNNAGIAGPTAPVKDMDPDQWEQVLRVGLTGTFNVTRMAIPHQIASGNGVVIIMSSAAGRFGYPNRSPYAAAKWGLIGFMKTLSMELATSARMRSCPAPSKGSGSSGCSPDVPRRAASPLRRSGQSRCRTRASSAWWIPQMSRP
jgi:NAD(P)-dependent dehydrogenase (short-subunit alcohol dehydrogenase family)